MNHHLIKTIFLSAILAIGFTVFTALRNIQITPYALENQYAPVSTFESSCARCHGPQGSFYGASFGKLPDAKLKKFVKDMMKGPAGLDPTQADIDAMTAYQQAIAAKVPFIFISAIDTLKTGVQFSGECMPENRLLLITGKDSLEIQIDQEGKWQSQSVKPSSKISFLAMNGNDTVILDPLKSKWSHIAE